MRFTRRGSPAEIGSIDLLEEATHLLRQAPLSAWLVYCCGGLPFALGLLYFIADMSRGARAWDHLAEASLALALLFAVMKTGQALFCDRLLRHLGGETSTTQYRRLPRVFFSQLAMQPFGLFLLPVALLLTLPFGWCFALFQNFTVFGQGREPLRRAIGRSWRQSQLWPGQNHLVIALLSVYGLALIPAIAATLYLLPHLLHRLFGIDSVFVHSNAYLLNSTFWSVVILLSYLFLDPLVKAVYVLRCFYGASQSTGADLRVELRRLQTTALRVLVALLLGNSVLGAVAPAGADNSAVSTKELRQAIDSEMNSPRYEWRLPREPVPDDYDPGLLASVGDSLIDGLQWLGEQLKSFVETVYDWFTRLLPEPEQEAGTPPAFLQNADPLLLALYLLCGVGLCMAAIWLYRFWRRRQRPETLAVEALPAIPDLEADEVCADELPADRWCSLAQDLLAKGEVRLALRALLLGALARLGATGYLQLARHKSNRDYLHEVTRRGAASGEVVGALSDTIAIMEAVWYGDHVVDAEGMQRFMAGHERIMRHG